MSRDACFLLYGPVSVMAIPGLRLLPLIVSQTNPVSNATVIFLHGSGDSGNGVKQWVDMVWGKAFDFPHIKIIYPTANPMPYTPMQGLNSTVWFDRLQISKKVPEHRQSIDEMATILSGLVQREINSGIPPSRIIIGGFSMGAAMAFHMAYRFHKDIAGVFALSGFLNNESVVFEVVKSFEDKAKLPPLFQCHGVRDELVLSKWGSKTFQKLSELGVYGEYHEFNMFHEFNREELKLLQEWILKTLPENKSAM